jgi:Family of unknown function (DUF6174)
MLAKWQNLGPSNYSFSFERTCFCSPKVLSGTVKVSGGKVVGVSDAQGDGAPIANPQLADFKSIEELFGILQTAIPVTDVLTVAFDPVLGFPIWIDIDYDVAVADDGFIHQASNVQPSP